MRQLNFYGFRKIKVGSSGVWKFHHDFFQRGRADLLGNIRKNNNTGEVERLKHQVEILRNELSNMGQDVTELKAMVASLVKDKNAAAEAAQKLPVFYYNQRAISDESSRSVPEPLRATTIVAAATAAPTVAMLPPMDFNDMGWYSVTATVGVSSPAALGPAAPIDVQPLPFFHDQSVSLFDEDNILAVLLDDDLEENGSAAAPQA